MKLTEYLTSIANAIREKTGKTEKINAQNFANEILAIKSGGSGNLAQFVDGSLINITASDIAGATKINSNAFSYSNIESIEIPNSVTEIGSEAFRYCQSLKKVTIPKSVEFIGYCAFYNCSVLNEIYYMGSIEDWCNIDFEDENSTPMSSANSDNALYINGELVENLVIPETVNHLTKGVFSSIGSLKTVIIPQSIETFGKYAFSNCQNMVSAKIDTLSIGDYAFENCSSLTSVTIGDSVTSIGSDVFRNCTSLTSVTIPDSVTTIGVDAFRNCSSLTSIVIPDSVTSIGMQTFRGCDSLTSVTIGNSATFIGDDTFYKCTSLTSVTIGDSVTSIGGYAFYECKSLTSVVIPDSVTQIRDYAFKYCSILTTVTMGNSVTSIGVDAFYGCKKLKRVDFSASTKIPSIGGSGSIQGETDLQIKVPASLIDEWKNATKWSTYADKIVTEFTNEI